MKTILIAAVSVFGFVGIASAQQAPFLFGNYSPNVLNEFDGFSDGAPMTGIDSSVRTSSIRSTGSGSHNMDPAGIAVAQPDVTWKPCLDIVSAQSCGSIRSGR